MCWAIVAAGGAVRGARNGPLVVLVQFTGNVVLLLLVVVLFQLLLRGLLIDERAVCRRYDAAAAARD